MAAKFQVSMDDFSHWEIVNGSDDEVSVYGVESLDSLSDVDERVHDLHDAVIRSELMDDRDGDVAGEDAEVRVVDADAMREESRSSDDFSDRSNRVVVNDDVVREESRSRDDVSDSGDVMSLGRHSDALVKDSDDMMIPREESWQWRWSDDVINSRYHVETHPDVNNDDVQQKHDLFTDDDVTASEAQSCDDVIDSSHKNGHNPYKYQNHDCDDYDDYDDYAEDDYDVDDELFPWAVKDKFGRQRIRKLGKRSCVKKMKAKQSPLLYNKPGCVRGKHGLGIMVY